MRLFVDWDGTVTVEDSLVQVIHAFGDPAILAELEPRVGVDLTLHEEIAAEFAAVDALLADVVEWVLANVHVRPGLVELAEFRPVIVSAGFHELIEPVLRREGIELEVLANRVESRPDGWRVHAAASRASAPAWPERRTPTSATATRTAAPRSPPTACSRATRSRVILRSSALPTSRSTTGPGSRPSFAARRGLLRAAVAAPRRTGRGTTLRGGGGWCRFRTSG